MENYNKSILIIDHDPASRQQMHDALVTAFSGFAIKPCASIEEALSFINHQLPKLIICDYFLSDGDASLLLNHSTLKDIVPVIIITAKGNEQIAVSAIKSGAMDYLNKTTSSIASLADNCRNALAEWEAIQQQKNTEQRLVANEAHLTFAQKIAHLGSWEWNLSSNEISCSGELHRMLGMTKQRFQNGFDDMLHFIHRDDREAVTSTLENVIKNKRSFVVEFRLIQPDDKQLMIKSEGRPVLSDTGELSHICGIFQDISQSHETYKQLHLLASALEASADSVVITDYNGQIVWANPAMTRLTGYKYTELIGETPNLWHSLNQDKKLFNDLWQTILAGNTWQGEIVNRKKNGEEYLEEQTITSVLNERGEITHFVSIKRDISKRKEIESRNLQAAKVFEHSIEGILICDANNTVTRVNPAFSVITGYKENEIIGKKPNILNSGKHDKSFFVEMWQQLSAQGVWQGEIWNRRKNGEPYPEFLTISTLKGSDNEIVEYIAIFTDITEQKQDAEHIHRLAYYDRLTNLPNRSLIQEVLKKALTMRSNASDQIGVLNIDIDRFFTINETMGHEFGDQLLQIITRRILRCTGELDKTARISSDEFTMICPDFDSPSTLGMKSQRILDSIAEPIMLNNQEVFITASIGIAIAPADGNEETILFRNAESARKHAKQEGNSYQFFNTAMNQQGFEQLVMKSSLRRALERNEFELYYQPQTDLKTGKIVGAESLIRWHHPDLGIVSPNKFIPILEETGLIIEVGEWVLQTACQQNKAWQDQGIEPVQIAVNLSPRQFRQINLVKSVSKVLDTSGLAAHWLELEVTESSIMHNPEEVVVTLKDLHNLGIKISIDDFGTGYSSLNYLKTFPIDVLKIDRSFIRDLTFDTDDEIIVKTIIAMGHNLGLKIIAEGVEDKKQLERIQQFQCDWYQGFYCDRPLPASDFEALLKRQNNHSMALN